MRLKAIPAYQPTIVVATIILYLTLLPDPLGDEEISLFDGADKVVHFIMFGGLTGTYLFERWRLGKPEKIRGALLAALIVSIFGVIVEILQWGMQMGRTGNDPLDALANTAGAFTAVLICKSLRWIAKD